MKSFDDAITNFQKLAFEKITETLGEAIENFGVRIMEIGKKIWDFVSTLGGLLNKTSFGGGGSDGGGGVTNASWSGGGGGVGKFTGDYGGMQPYFKTRLDSLLEDAKKSGHPLYVKSGYRSQAHQDALFARSDHSGHWVARHSHHTMGIAADLGGDLAWAHQHAAEHGLRFPMPREHWHIEPSGGPPKHKAPSGGGQEVNLHTHVHLDGKQFAHVVQKHISVASQFPRQAPYFDGSRSFTSPIMASRQSNVHHRARTLELYPGRLAPRNRRHQGQI